MGMIDDILALSHFEMTDFSLNKESISLGELLKDTVEIAEELFRDRPIQLETDIAPNLPSLIMDRTRIRQVMLNLLNNAQRFTEAGTVRLTAQQSEDEILISVSDTGSGIPEKKLPHIFEEFYQIDSSLTRKHQGAGLGLAISKRFIEAHGGHIWAESQEGEGSIFFFTLPVNPNFHLWSKCSKDAPKSDWSDGHPHILFLDSGPAVPPLVKSYLEEYDIVQVKSIDHLSAAINLHHPQMVVCNVAPNKASPYDEINVPVPVIECSLPGHTWITAELGIEAFLTKPVTSERLLFEIGRLENINHILVVDDNRDFFQLIKRMLAAVGQNFTVTHAYDGDEGLTMMRTHPPDLVLLDMIIPEHSNGIQIREQMCQEPELADIPVILLTASNLMAGILAQPESKIVIHRSGGLQPNEILSCLRALSSVLEPRYDESSLAK
jgi:CheY-like chemotaxis protein